MFALDYSQGRPRGSEVARLGYGAVNRYLANGLSGRTNLSAAEVNDMHANGVAVVLVWERKIIGQPDRATEGWNAGVTDAQAALAQAQAVGLPNNPIYFCIDFDIPDYAPKSTDSRAKLGPCGDYLAGALSVVGIARMGVYGGFYAVSRAIDAGLGTYFWQAVAWSGGQKDPRIHMFQRLGTVTVDGVGCDVSEVYKSDFGQNEVDDMGPDDLISPDGMVGADGKQVTDKVKNFLGYGDKFAREAKEAVESLAATFNNFMQSTNAKLDAMQQQLNTLQGQADSEVAGEYEVSNVTLTKKAQS